MLRVEAIEKAGCPMAAPQQFDTFTPNQACLLSTTMEAFYRVVAGV